MKPNETVAALPADQVRAINRYCAAMIRDRVHKIPAIKALRDAHFALTGEKLPLKTAKDVVDHGYQARYNILVMDELPRALRERDAATVATLHAERTFLADNYGLFVSL